MQLHFLYRYTVLYMLFIISVVLSACKNDSIPSSINIVPSSHTSPSSGNINSESLPTITHEEPVPTISSVPIKKEDNPSIESISNLSKSKNKGQILINKTILTLGDSFDQVIHKFGNPNRIIETEYDFEYYVYNNNYTNFFMIAIKNKSVVGFYTDSLSFNFLGITPEHSINDINRLLRQSYEIEEILTYSTNHYTLKLLIDKFGTQRVTGVYVLSNTVQYHGFNNAVDKGVELLVYDLTNSIRARNDVSILSWSSTAAISSKKHSTNMATNNFFDHLNPSGKHPGDRMRAEGIALRNYGENIIAGYGTAILSSHGWFNSSGHRKTILNPIFRYLGVGFYYDADSNYKTYITQNFYR